MPDVYHSVGTAELWTQFSDRYDATVVSVTSFADKRAQILRDMKPGLVLDAGCGPLGLMLRDVSAAPGTHAVGFDFSEAMIAESRRRTADVPVHYALADLRQLPVVNGSIDTMIAVNSFIPETRPEVEAMFHEASRALKPGGRLIAVLPSFEMSLVARDKWGMKVQLDLTNEREWDTSGWQCFYTAAAIARLTDRHGFSRHALDRLVFSTPDEIAHIRRVYRDALSAVSADRLVADPLVEHLLVAER